MEREMDEGLDEILGDFMNKLDHHGAKKTSTSTYVSN